MTKKKNQNHSNSVKNIRRRKRRMEQHTGIDWIDPEKGYGVVRGEQALWRAVILQMLEDAVSKSKKPQDKFDREQARHWLQGNHKDFYMVCDLAGFDIEYARKQIKKALLNHCHWRKVPAKPIKKPMDKSLCKKPKQEQQTLESNVLAFNPFLKKSA